MPILSTFTLIFSFFLPANSLVVICKQWCFAYNSPYWECSYAEKEKDTVGFLTHVTLKIMLIHAEHILNTIISLREK